VVEPSERLTRIEAALRAALAPEQLEVHDESHRHRGHAGAADGRGHFRVRIVSPRFVGEKRLARHRMVYAALGAELESEVHALAIQALAPGEEGS
jgi:BolA protein